MKQITGILTVILLAVTLLIGLTACAREPVLPHSNATDPMDVTHTGEIDPGTVPSSTASAVQDPTAQPPGTESTDATPQTADTVPTESQPPESIPLESDPPETDPQETDPPETQPETDPPETQPEATVSVQTLEQETQVLSQGEAAIPMQATTEAPGTLAKSCEDATIDYSNTADGYVMVRYEKATSQRLKAQVKGPATTYTYNLTP